MKRRTFDILMAAAGLFLAVTLIAAGGLLTWAHTFIGNEVHTLWGARTRPLVLTLAFMRPAGIR